MSSLEFDFINEVRVTTLAYLPIHKKQRNHSKNFFAKMYAEMSQYTCTNITYPYMRNSAITAGKFTAETYAGMSKPLSMIIQHTAGIT